MPHPPSTTIPPHPIFPDSQLKTSNPLPEDELITDVSDRITNILKRMEKELDAADKQMNYSLKVPSLTISASQ